MDVPVEVATARVRSRPSEKNRYIDMDLQYRLRNEYLRICFENNGVLIPSDSTPDETFKAVLKSVKEVLEEK